MAIKIGGKDIAGLVVGTSSGNKDVIAVWQGTISGNKLLWSNAGAVNPVLPPGYGWATDSDFQENYDGDLTYIGAKSRVMIPKTLNGEEVQSYKNMFGGVQGLEGVANAPGSIATNADFMFAYIEFEHLDLSYLDTSSIINMIGMFAGVQAKTINLRGFDTSNVVNMAELFAFATVPIVDLSSFDMSNVVDDNYMFIYADIQRGYARTQADADILNANTSMPDGLTFEVVNGIYTEGGFSTGGRQGYGRDPVYEIRKKDSNTLVVSSEDWPNLIKTSHKSGQYEGYTYFFNNQDFDLIEGEEYYFKQINPGSYYDNSAYLQLYKAHTEPINFVFEHRYEYSIKSELPPL